jgi:menaquinone-dependent protoporphyrinogen IX oxidase
VAKPILIAYTTNSGSTSETVKIIAEEITRTGRQVEVRRLEEVTNLEVYGAAVIGAPMILGWHGDAIQFIKKNRRALEKIPVAYFATMMKLTKEKNAYPDAPPLAIDFKLAAAPRQANRLSLEERYSSISNYLRPMVRSVPSVRPVSVAFFGGKLEMFRLKWWQMLFVLLIVRAKPGDLRNWPFIKQWAADLGSKLA